MPIGRPGTDDHRHFQSLYDNLIKPTVSQLGYQVHRADDSQLSGAIAKDIVQKLAECDLVIADLTTANPNVFYEVGVRHALRRKGTVLIIDELRTQKIPFDISGYRAVKFKGDVEGVLNLQGELKSAIEAHKVADNDHRDNPVHDFLPALPADALSGARGSDVQALQEELAAAHERLREYERGRPDNPEGPADSISALPAVVDALADARDGNLIADLVESAEQAASKGNREEFLGLVRRILEHSDTLDASSYVALATHCTRLGLRSVALAMYDEAHHVHPRDERVRDARLAHLTHSQDGTDRLTARNELRQILGVTVHKDGNVTVPPTLTEQQRELLGLMLDAYHHDGLHDEALRISEALFSQLPTKSTVVRNYARALENSGFEAQALEKYVEATRCTDADDTSAKWLGNTFHNMSRHVDGLEYHLLACLLDPYDGTNFAYAATEIAWAMECALTGTDRSARPLPDSITTETLKRAILAAFSAPNFGLEAQRRCSQAARHAEIPSDWIANLTSLMETVDADEVRMKAQDRYDFAYELYEELGGGTAESAGTEAAATG